MAAPATTAAITAPQALDLEAAMLGAVLLDPRYLADVRALTAPDDCYWLKHRTVFEVMLALADAGQVVDALTVGDGLAARGRFEDVGGDPFLASLAAACPDPARAADYARTVAARAYDRHLLAVADAIRAKALDARIDPRLKRAQIDALLSGGPDVASTSTVPMRELMGGYLDDIEATVGTPDGPSGLSTGFKDIDDLLDGLREESLNYVGARPGMGKTSLLLSIALRVAAAGRRVYFWSGEMSRKQIRERMVAACTGVAGATLRRGFRTGGLTERQWSATVGAAGTLSQYRIMVDDGEDMTPALLRAHAEMVARRWGGLDLICVDYIGLMEPGVKTQDRNNEIGYISRKLKRSVAKIAPVLCAAQLNRAVENRDNKRPVMRDLRDSGSMEQDADTVLFLYRDVVYNPTTAMPDGAELIVAKNRHGAAGTITLRFDQRLTRFEDATVTRVDWSGQ